ncbi:hypothetical protein MMC34_007099 [Xylographa carneopallida]|nr:hypothetical protein [Xylographa carneopallida]
MHTLKASISVAAILLGNRVVAHGIVTGIVAGGNYYSGYNPSFQFVNSIPKGTFLCWKSVLFVDFNYAIVAGWSSPEDLSLGFISPSNYSTPEIICHLGATPGATYVNVAAGGTVELQWSVWPSSHHGPVIDYLANCNGDCTNVDKTTLLFNKIDSVGLISDTTAPGIWASDQLVANNNSWTVTIPTTVAPGNYVLRHEIIALHSAENPNGAQNYPQCVNLKVTGSGADSLSSGTLGTSLYTSTDPSVLFNIYTTPLSYTVPGPALLVSDVQPISAQASSTLSPFSNITSTLRGSVVPSSSSLITTLSTSTNAIATLLGSSVTATSVPLILQTMASVPTPAATMSSLIGPESVSSMAASLADSLPSACSNTALPTITNAALTTASTVALPASNTALAAPKDTSTLNVSSSSPDIPLPAGLTLNEFFTWLQSVAINMFRSGKGPSVEHVRRHARAVRL